MFSEQDVDKELQAALSVSPSPDFEARVLQRVEEDRTTRIPALGLGRFVLSSAPSPRSLKTAGLLAAASLVIIAGLFYALSRTPGVQPSWTPQVVEHPSAPPVEQATGTRVHEPFVPAPVAPDRTPRSTPRTTEPEVIVPLNQMEAVRRLVRAVNEGRIPAPTEAVETPAVVPKEVVVAPLVVDPIAVPALEPDADAPSPIIRGHS